MPIIDSYQSAIDFLFGRINYERVQVEAYSTSDFKLDRMRLLLSLIDNPQEKIPTIHVAGTKGKGSTCSMIASVLANSGYRAGLYISPHITAFEERMTVNGVMPSHEELVSLLNQLMPTIKHMDGLPGQMQPTYFELATALAWLYFIERRVDFAVLEVGLGGRLDSTNVCHPLVSIVTNVSRDHTHVLGSTVRQIAWEKAGIIKPGIPVVSGVSHPDAIDIVEQACQERGCSLMLLGRDIHVSRRDRFATNSNVDQVNQAPPMAVSVSAIDGEYEPNECGSIITVRTKYTEWTDVSVALRGAHQATNAALVLGAIDTLRQQGISIPEASVRRGLATTTWPARVEVIGHRPTVVVDAAHNWESAKALVATLRDDFRVRSKYLIFAATRDKDVAGLMRLLIPEFDTVILTRYLDNPRGVPVSELHSWIRSVSNREVHLTETPLEAWNLAKRWASADDLIAITGSFFLVAELRDVVLSDQDSALTSSKT